MIHHQPSKGTPSWKDALNIKYQIKNFAISEIELLNCNFTLVRDALCCMLTLVNHIVCPTKIKDQISKNFFVDISSLAWAGQKTFILNIIQQKQDKKHVTALSSSDLKDY